MTNKKQNQQSKMNKQDTREKAASFLDEIREGVAKIIEQPGKGFDFSMYVKEFDKEHHCGTVACMEGWIPAIRPDLAQWKISDDKTFLFAIGINSMFGFCPDEEGIPIDYTLWEALTIFSLQDNIGERNLDREASFSEVSDLWKRTAERIRKGELDDFLIFENQ